MNVTIRDSKPVHYLEDFAVGQKYRSTRLPVDAAAIKSFANAFDPQPFHLDEEAARSTFFGGLAASGWHTAALTMRLLVESDLRPAGGIIGARGEELTWPRTVRPGDELEIETEVLEVRPSGSRPRHGFVKFRTTGLLPVLPEPSTALSATPALRRRGQGARGARCEVRAVISPNVVKSRSRARAAACLASGVRHA